ncbi:MAG: SAF domain-containing protein, partial [Acidimicrobiia bacterium]
MAAAVMDFRRTPTTTHPFLTEKVEAGAAIGAGDLAWRRVPEGLLPLPDLLEPVAASDLAAGEPLLPSHLATEVVV